MPVIFHNAPFARFSKSPKIAGSIPNRDTTIAAKVVEKNTAPRLLIAASIRVDLLLWSHQLQNARTGTLIWSLVSTVFLLFILVAVLVFFIYRYGSERNKRKKYESRYGVLEGSKNNGTHREVFAEIGLIGVHQQHNKPPCTPIDDLEDFGSLDLSTNQPVENFYLSKKERSDRIRKHSGFRGRLDATSTSIS
ncbi:unnamed protein product [Onchocerca ochengi]|uniref:Uncharacterized protein n=1 Tax=Onchocerca ochengi TaxID=42157 RepID=A0A182E1D9_ONCOC|nr:unnamed protein product [Onchocerca ochengi]